jgi:hypothetical protein
MEHPDRVNLCVHPVRLLLTLAVALCLGLASTARAVPITITNHDFEDPVLGGDGSINRTPPGSVTGWVTSGNGTIGTFDPDQDYYSDALILDGGATSGQIGTMDGAQVAFFFDSSTGLFAQTLADTLLANSQYTLTVAVGDRDNQPLVDFGTYFIELQAGGVSLATATGSTAPGGDGTFADVSLVFTTGATHPQLGQALAIVLGSTENGQVQVDYDNVRLDVVPEPSTALLVALGLIGLGLGAPRKAPSRRSDR